MILIWDRFLTQYWSSNNLYLYDMEKWTLDVWEQLLQFLYTDYWDENTVCFLAVSCTVCFVIWQIMEHTRRCVAVSEPNAPTVFVGTCLKFGDSLELRQLARDIIRWECRPYPTMQPPPLGYCLKLMRRCFSLLPMLRQHCHSVIIWLST